MHSILQGLARAPRTPRIWSNCTVPASVGSTSSLEYFLQVCQYYAGSGPAASCAGMGLPGPSESALQLDDIDAGRSKLGAFRSILGASTVALAVRTHGSGIGIPSQERSGRWTLDARICATLSSLVHLRPSGPSCSSCQCFNVDV